MAPQQSVKGRAARVVVADRCPRARAELASWLRDEGHAVHEAEDGAAVLELARTEHLDAAILAVDLPDRSGLDVLAHLAQLDPAPAVLLVADRTDVQTAVSALRRGAADILERPLCEEHLREILGRSVPARAVRRERDTLRDEVLRLRAGPIVGRSPAIRLLLEHVERVAATPRTTALVLGEPGVGKELVARAIHERSARCDGPFVAVNCAALSESVLEAELFGHEPGALPDGSPRGRDGLVAAAEGGTLFLDEIGELPPALQAKLLGALQGRTFRRVGGSRDRAMDARVVASTHRDLAARVDAGAFRSDLYYRLNVLTLHVPPLRERPEDVVPLAEHFLRGFAVEFGKELPGFAADALERLTSHAWPGNVRELRNAVERAALLGTAGQPLEADHLAPEARAPRIEPVPGPAPLEVEDLSLRSVERALIRRVLAETDGNRSRAARILGVNRTTLYNKLRVLEKR